MKKFFYTLAAIFMLMGIAASHCHAKTAYVSDMLVLTFREGPGNNFSVKQTLPSNTPLTILGEENGFYKAALATGEQGWVNKNFIMFDLPKALIIEKLTQEKQALEKRISDMEAGAVDHAQTMSDASDADAREKAAELAAELARIKMENKALAHKLKQTKEQFTALKNAASNTSDTLSENKRLKAENKTLLSTIDRLENGGRNMFKSAMIKWFLSGFGVLITGWVIGRSVSSRKKRSGSLY
ncbi:MAG: peptide-binding protein [Desulfobacterales bacterium]|nr:MAG: peptide-binding protein [Desulfobacterales bacterium]